MNKDALKKLISAVEAGDVNDGCGVFYTQDMELLAIRSYHGSLDAAKALHEALLPGWGWMTGDGGSAALLPPLALKANGAISPVVRVRGNQARAWLLAILKAKLAEVTV